MSKTIDFDISGMMDQFERDHHQEKKGEAKKYPELVSLRDELTCHVYVNATIALLVTLGEKEETIHHVNDTMQFSDFPGATPEVLEELSDMTGFEVTLDTLIWEAAKALSTGESPKHRARFH